MHYLHEHCGVGGGGGGGMDTAGNLTDALPA